MIPNMYFNAVLIGTTLRGRIHFTYFVSVISNCNGNVKQPHRLQLRKISSLTSRPTLAYLI